MEEIVVAKEMSDCGVGPRLYGVFPGGRVEEFVAGSTLTPDDYANNETMEQLAMTFARFHACKPPLVKNRFNDILKMDHSISDFEKERLFKEFEKDRPDLVHMLRDVVTWDLQPEIEQMMQIFEKHRFRQSFTLFDTNSLNIMASSDKKRVVLIDYEISVYGYSAIDLGRPLINRQVNARNMDQPLSGLEYQSHDEIKQYVSAYVDECQRLGTWGSHEDLDRLVLEAEFGVLFTCLFIRSMVFAIPDLLIERKNILILLHRWYQHYTSSKDRLMRQLEQRYDEILQCNNCLKRLQSA